LALMGAPYSPKKDPTEDSIKGMIEWFNTRQKAIEDAQKDIPHENVEIYQYAEVNMVQKAINGGVTLTNNVLPFTNVDYVSYSAYDTVNKLYKYKDSPEEWLALMEKELPPALDYIESKLKAKDIEGKRVFIGEYGFPIKHLKTAEKQDKASRVVMAAALEWSCPFIVYWEVYCNENLSGFWLIDDKNIKQPIYYTHQEFYKRGKKYVQDYLKENGKKPTQQEFLKIAAGWLKLEK